MVPHKTSQQNLDSIIHKFFGIKQRFRQQTKQMPNQNFHRNIHEIV